MPDPGWYPDPTDDFERRWWDGRQWTDQVQTGRFAGASPVQASFVPDQEAEVWSGSGAVFTTHRVRLNEGSKPLELAWWMVRDVDVRLSDVVLVVDFPGYTDKRERRLRHVKDADWVGAIARMWARRNRRRASA